MSFQLTVGSDIINKLPRKLANHYRLAAIGMEDDRVILATDTENTSKLQEELEISLPFEFVLQQIASNELNTLLHKYYFEDISNQGQEKSTLQYNTEFLETLILEAKRLKSSDIHIESFENRGRVRIRIDGMMVERV